jgi:hypothetical protein
MLPLFTNPVAFWGLLAVPVLVGIYFLRTRPRRYPVSSLMLWLEPSETRQGGTRIARLVTPLLLILELLALALLVLAAAEPHLPLRERVRPLIVILDDSYSMQAGGEHSPRKLAAQALEEELKQRPRHSVRFLLAGDMTQVLGEPAGTTTETMDRLRDWHGQAASSQLEEALAFARDVAGELPLLLVLTDHAPPTEMQKGRVQWWSFGQPRSNVAIVNAARTPHEGRERALLEIVNYADDPTKTRLLLETIDPPQPLQRSTLHLQPRATNRVILTLPEHSSRLHARIDDDELSIDNAVSLLPSSLRPIRIALRCKDKTFQELIDKAVQATHRAVSVKERPDILFTDQEDTPLDAGDAWIVHLLAEANAVVYAGPFVLDRNHPLTEGLSLQGVVWGAGKSTDVLGSPVILAGDVPLLTDRQPRAHQHELWLRLRPYLSTLPDAPGWPVLIWNLLQWRASEKPGLPRTNYRLGERVDMTFATPRESVVITRPHDVVRTMPVQDRRLSLRADEVGIWSIAAEEESVTFAVNALFGEESDLTGCVTGRWGDWLDETTLRLEYQSVFWVLLLGVLAVATIHLWLVARSRGRA